MAVRHLTQFNRAPQAPARTSGSGMVTSLQDEINRLFDGFFGRSMPAVWENEGNEIAALRPALDVAETDKDISITVELPGLDRKDVEVTVSDNYITIKGEKRDERKEEHNGYYRRERSYGSFQRIVALPETADTAKAKADVDKGVLTINVPKKENASPKERKLEIK